jgi:hypothetical protein
MLGYFVMKSRHIVIIYHNKWPKWQLLTWLASGYLKEGDADSLLPVKSDRHIDHRVNRCRGG